MGFLMASQRGPSDVLTDLGITVFLKQGLVRQRLAIQLSIYFLSHMDAAGTAVLGCRCSQKIF